MSIHIMNRVWEESAQSEGSLLVLLAMADNADHAGICWPSQLTIAAKARLSERQVRRVIEKLIGDRELEIVKPAAGRGKRTVYRVIVKADNMSSFQNQKADIGDIKRRTLATPSILKESSLEPSPASADEIYAAYPRKIGRPAALRAIQKAIASFGADALLVKTKEFAAAWDGKDERHFIPYPQKWFNQERYTDDPQTWLRTNGNSHHQRSTPESSRNIGTANEGKSAQYRGIGKVRSVQGPGGSGA